MLFNKDNTISFSTTLSFRISCVSPVLLAALRCRRNTCFGIFGCSCSARKELHFGRCLRLPENCCKYQRAVGSSRKHLCNCQWLISRELAAKMRGGVVPLLTELIDNSSPGVRKSPTELGDHSSLAESLSLTVIIPGGEVLSTFIIG